MAPPLRQGFGGPVSSGQILRYAIAVLLLIGAALVIWRIVYGLLLAFAGILVAVFIRGISTRIQRWTGWPMGLAVGLTWVGLVGLAALSAWLMGPAIVSQLGQLRDNIPRAIHSINGFLQHHSWGQDLLDRLKEKGGGAGNPLAIFAPLTDTLSMAIDVAVALIVILFTGIYFSAQPQLYLDGAIRLVPVSRRRQYRIIIDDLGAALRGWALGKVLAMLVIGLLSGLGLFLIGVPLAMILGLISGVTELVPFIGPLIGAVPALLLALTVDPKAVLYVLGLFLFIHQFEAHVVTPLIQHVTVNLPPVLVALAVVAFGLLFGLLGVILAVPLLVVALVLVKRLYIEDVLGDRAGAADPREAA